MSTNIHQTAVIEDGAQIGENVVIGPYCVISGKSKIGDGCHFHAHSVVQGKTTIGKNNEFFPYAIIGSPPQDLSYKGEETEVIIGDHNIFREFFSINRGTTKQDLKTIIGNHNLFMSYCHMGHDVEIGDHIRVVNSCNFAGHVKVGDYAIISGGSNISQYVTVGRAAFIGGGSAIDRDVPCYTTAYGNRVKLKGINIIGLKRRGVEKSHISELVEFYRQMEASALSPRSFVESPEFQEEYKGNQLIAEFSEFISNSRIGIPPFMS
jgi:UDP-N-acetylglucosamine acyltransferase